MIFVVITAAIDSDFSCEMALMMVQKMGRSSSLKAQRQDPRPR